MEKKVASLAVILFVASMVIYMSSPAKARAVSGDVAAGLEIHKKNCQKCHGPEGKGDGPAGKLLKTKPADWSDKAKFSKLSDEDLFKIISKGGEAAGKSKLMPAFGDKLSEQDIRNTIAFIRSLAK